MVAQGELPRKQRTQLQGKREKLCGPQSWPSCQTWREGSTEKIDRSMREAERKFSSNIIPGTAEEILRLRCTSAAHERKIFLFISRRVARSAMGHSE
jgi:hypothetical protein